MLFWPWIGYSSLFACIESESMEYSCMWLSHITSVANVKSTNLGANFKEKQNIFLSMCIDDITPVCLKFTLVLKVQTSTANISKTKHRKLTKISPECLDCITLWNIKNNFGSGLSFNEFISPSWKLVLDRPFRLQTAPSHQSGKTVPPPSPNSEVLCLIPFIMEMDEMHLLLVM